MTLRQLMTEPTGYTPKTKDQAKALFRKWSLFRKSDDHDADQAGSRDKFQEAVGIVTTDAAGIAAIGLGLAQVMHWIAAKGATAGIEFLNKIKEETMRDALRYDRVAIVRCYINAETNPNGRRASLATRVKLTTSAWKVAIVDMVDDSGEKIIGLLKGGGAVKDLPSYVGDSGWEASPACHVVLCFGDCKAGDAHRELGSASSTTSVHNRSPGCGHCESGLCTKCESWQTENTLHCCAKCSSAFRNPSAQALKLAHVTPAVTEGTSSQHLTGHVKECYLRACGTVDGKKEFKLIDDALEGRTKMDAVEIKMLQAAAPGGQQLKPDTKYHIVGTTLLGTHGGGLCGSCARLTISDETAIAGESEADDTEVKLLHNQDDLIGLVAARAVASETEEKATLQQDFETASKNATAVPNHVKDFLKSVSKWGNHGLASK